MHRLNLHALMLAAICILLVIGGQTLMKLAIVRSGGMPVLEIGIAGLIRKFMDVPYILIGFALYGVSRLNPIQVIAHPLVQVHKIVHRGFRLHSSSPRTAVFPTDRGRPVPSWSARRSVRRRSNHSSR